MTRVFLTLVGAAVVGAGVTLARRQRQLEQAQAGLRAEMIDALHQYADETNATLTAFTKAVTKALAALAAPPSSTS